MAKSRYEVEEMILGMVDTVLEKQELARDNYELETGNVCCFNEECERIKRRMFEAALRGLFSDCNQDGVLMSIIDSMYEPIGR